MREVNFSIPNANKASVGITTALYDRRALDCTSTLPLINSLNHLAYLTTSSARIRDILTVDGGVERLVCILKEGKSKDMMEMWKWNLAFQCVVNIGVRGSESVRTRVVEADMVPVIATILDNYVRVVDKVREKAEAEMKRNSRIGSSKHYSRSNDLTSVSGHRSERSRRQAPPPIAIPNPYSQPSLDIRGIYSPTPPAFSLSSPPERTTFTRPHHHHHHRSHEGRTPLFGTNNARPLISQPLMTAAPLMDSTQDTFNIRPVRDVDRLPSMLPALQAEITSQPESPTTPSAPAQLRPRSPTDPSGSVLLHRRPSIRHQLSMSGESDESQTDELMANASDSVTPTAEPIVGLQNDINMQDVVDGEEMLDAGTTPVRITPPAGESTETETFNITHRSAIDGSIINPAATQAAANLGFSPLQTTLNPVNATPPPMSVGWYPRFPQDRLPAAGVFADMPREEDVLMSLQLLAYVSKYCNLRSYFQKSHLVPRLKLASDLSMLDPDATPTTTMIEETDPDEEYLLPDDFNIFPLVEKFTVRHHTGDMQYWAGVVMRNLCRKDDSRGGIRQCAYYKCGKWEKVTREFAKCRRCRRTKYCSKECQKSAWVYHRHWCVAAQQ